MRTHRFIRRFSRGLRYLNAFVLIAAVSGAGFFAGAVARIRSALPPSEQLASYMPHVTTEIYSTERQKDGTESHTLLARFYKEDRTPVSLKDIPLALQQATIAREDRRFYQHRGVDPRGILRAMRQNLGVFFHGGEYTQGGSTITQQLARTIWLTREKTVARKLKEILLALELERRFSKDEILEMYVNEVNYGHGAYGVKTAAGLFFGKDLRDLTLGECSLLAGLPQRPAFYSPYTNPQAAKARRRSVLNWMVHEGYLTARQAQDADAEPIQSHLVKLRERGVTSYRALYFTFRVRDDLIRRFGWDIVYQGGLRVYTTLDWRLQQAAEEELRQQVEGLRAGGQIRGKLVGQGALACVEVRTGRVLAMVGGVGPYKDLQYNRADPGMPPWGRQPGSSFKPYIYAAALESGFGPESYMSGVQSISLPKGDGSYWHPKNYNTGQEHMWSLSGALAWSVNLVAIRLLREVTVDKAVRYASRLMDIPESRFEGSRYLSLALGTANISPLEQASGFAVFANGGLRAERTFVDRIDDYRGNVLRQVQPKTEQVIKPETAISMIQMLNGVITSGTGSTIAGYVNFPAGGKTGTTQGGCDAWWAGFTPDLSAAVWIGNEDNTPMYGASGSGFCAPVWARFMRRAIDLLGCKGQFPKGTGVTGWRRGQQEEKKTDTKTYTVCEESGGLATENCPATKQITLPKDKPPPPRCTLHGGPAVPGEDGGGVSVVICTQSGGRATENCPETEVRLFARGQVPGLCTMHGGRGRTEPPETKNAPETKSGGPGDTEPSPAEPPSVPSVPGQGKGDDNGP